MTADTASRFDRPIFIVSTPRSGSTVLFETLQQAPGLFTIGGESHKLIEGLQPFTPVAHDWSSNRLTEVDARHPAMPMMTSAFYAYLKDRDGTPAQGRVRMLEKTPKNSLRIPFLDAIWPDGLFVYLFRDPRQTLASMIRAWQSGKFKTYSNLPGWTGLPWSLVLVPGWQELNGKDLPEIVARQWVAATEVMLDDLSALGEDRVVAVDYEEFLADPQAEMERVAPLLGLGWDRRLPTTLPPSRMALTAPRPDKWRELEAELDPVLPIVAETAERARQAAQRWRE